MGSKLYLLTEIAKVLGYVENFSDDRRQDDSELLMERKILETAVLSNRSYFLTTDLWGISREVYDDFLGFDRMESCCSHGKDDLARKVKYFAQQMEYEYPINIVKHYSVGLFKRARNPNKHRFIVVEFENSERRYLLDTTFIQFFYDV